MARTEKSVKKSIVGSAIAGQLGSGRRVAKKIFGKDSAIFCPFDVVAERMNEANGRSPRLTRRLSPESGG